MKKGDKSIIKVIRKKLLNQEMSVLVGSGFSKNANNDFPLWSELLLDLVKELFKPEYENWKKSNPKKEEKEFLKIKSYDYDFLEIVEKYIKFKGMREAITFYIEDKLTHLNNDTANLDLETHKKLVDCPWNNIYTTNYETLLEQGAKASGKYDYKIINNSIDLSIRPHKRIIKLHGSLRSLKEIEKKDFGFDNNINSHYIISKTDYETYTERHSAFTHLMRIALLQESFCLIGFSGSDPNFLGWVNWVRDVLKNSKGKKVYFIDVREEECDRERELFFNNYKIEYVPLKIVYGNLTPKKLINKFFNDINSPGYEIKDVLEIPTQKKNYLKLWDKLESSKLFDKSFLDTLKEIEENETYFKLPSFSIFYKAELIIRRKRHEIIELIKKSKIDILEILNFVSLIQRNSYYNLSAIFSSAQLQLFIREFNKTNYNDLKEREVEKWLSFGISLLKDYRYTLNRRKFEELKQKLLLIKNLRSDIIEEIYYEESLFLAITLDYEQLVKKLEDWKITDNSSGFSCIRKAFLLNSLKNKESKEEIIKLINSSVKRTNIEQERLWFYEIISYYNYSINLNDDDYFNAQINNLKSKGLYALDSIIKSLTENKKNVEIKPSEETRYTITRSFGIDSQDDIDWDSVRFVEFLFDSGTPLIPDIKYPVSVFSKNKWFDIFIKTYEKMTNEMLFLSFQYSGNDAYENFIRSIVQNIVFNQNIKNELKNEILQNYSKSFFYYYDIGVYKPTFIFAISELTSCIQFDKWRLFINKLWDLQFSDKILHKRFFSNVWGLEKVILKMLPYIKDNKLLNKMICAFFEFSENSKNNDGELVSLKYIEKIINDNSFFKPYKTSIKRIGNHIEFLLNKNNLSNYELLKIYHYNRSFSKLYDDIIMKKINTIEFTQNHLLYFSLIIELSHNDDNVDKKLREYILSNSDFIFHTGINNKGGRSGGGPYFSIFKTFKTPNSKFYLNWSIEQIHNIYNILKSSLNLLAEYKKKKDVFFSFDDNSILNDMLQFLKLNKEYLASYTDYNILYDQIKSLHSAELGVKSIVSGLLSNDSNLIQNSIVALLKQYQIKPDEDNEIAWVTFLMRILRKDEIKLELSIEYFSILLSNILADKKWPIKYKSYFLKILNEYYNNIPFENTNRIFIEYNLIKIANALRINWKIKDPAIDKWLKLKKESNFLKIQNMKLTKSR